MENGFVDRGQRVFIIIYFYCFFFLFFLFVVSMVIISPLFSDSSVARGLSTTAISPEIHQHFYFPVF
jgi:hypothetical protein